MIIPTECAAVVAAAAAFSSAFEQFDGGVFERQAGELGRRELAELIEAINDVVGGAHELLTALREPVAEFGEEWDRELGDGASRLEFASRELGQVVGGLCPQRTATPVSGPGQDGALLSAGVDHRPVLGCTHDCPGGCGRPVARHHFACRSCWYRLPAPLRRAITSSYGRQPGAHGAAIRRANRWYRDDTPHQQTVSATATGRADRWETSR